MPDEQSRIEGYNELLARVAPGVGSWNEAVAPLITRFEIAANFGADAVHNGEGARALAELIKSMANILDTEIVARKEETHAG